MSEVLMDNFGLEWKTSKGEITFGDWAYNWDSGDVVGVDEDDDLYLRNETCTKVVTFDEANDWF